MPSLDIAERRSLGGGCIANTERIVTTDGRVFCLKQHAGSEGSAMFEAEAAGLRALASRRGPRVPKVEAVWTEENGAAFLLMEFIETGHRGKGFWSDFGERLARLHAEHRKDAFGFESNNYIGSTPQQNDWRSDWRAFFAELRLGYQIRLARTRGLADESMVRDVESIMRRIHDLLVEPEHPSVLHGDLWGGNYLCDENGTAAIIDPATYYGHREADLAMTELFGGFGREFYKAYEHEWPLQPGYSERRDLYNLYHMLNHLNLFGGAYHSAVKRICSAYT